MTSAPSLEPWRRQVWLRGWVGSLAVHGAFVGLACWFVWSLRLAPQPEPFRWQVSVVQAPATASASPVEPAVADAEQAPRVDRADASPSRDSSLRPAQDEIPAAPVRPDVTTPPPPSPLTPKPAPVMNERASPLHSFAPKPMAQTANPQTANRESTRPEPQSSAVPPIPPDRVPIRSEAAIAPSQLDHEIVPQEPPATHRVPPAPTTPTVTDLHPPEPTAPPLAHSEPRLTEEPPVQSAEPRLAEAQPTPDPPIAALPDPPVSEAVPEPLHQLAPAPSEASTTAPSAAPPVDQAAQQIARLPPTTTAPGAPTSAAPTDYSWLANGLMGRIAETIRYPAEARLNEWQGKVVVKLVINEDGTIHDLKVVTSSGYAILDQEALTLLQRLSPLTLDRPLGKNRISLQVPIRYSLKERF